MDASKNNSSKRRVVFTILTNVTMIAIIAVLSVFVYRSMLKVEEKNCWGILEDSAEAVEKEIRIQVENNINILRLVSDAMVREERTGASQENLEAIVSHLNDFRDLTIFERIDVLLENGSILLQTGQLRESTMDFQAIAEKGVSISGRRTDAETGKEVIRCAVPVIKEQQTVAILLGVISCEELPKLFSSSMYDGNAYVCLIDRMTGDFIMDNWHERLGNLYEMNNRKMLPDYEHIDPREEISQGNAGVVAYESEVNGKASYMYFQPVRGSNWQIIVVAQEDEVFRSLNETKQFLSYMITIVGILLFGYLLWTGSLLWDSLKRAEESEKHSFIDSMTGIYNQNKFQQTINDYAKKDLTGIGLIFLDLNGLKYTNDHFGHAAGDRLLRNTARILSDIFGSAVYRVGGDEFVVLTADCSRKDFCVMSARAQKEMKSNGIEVAMGITWSPDSSAVKAQLKEADDLMYIAKRSYHKRDTEQASFEQKLPAQEQSEQQQSE